MRLPLRLFRRLAGSGGMCCIPANQNGEESVKLVLFQSAPDGEIAPGLITGRGVVDISGAVRKGHTPQLTMQGIIDDFDRLKPALEKLAAEGKAVPADKVQLKAPLPRPGKILCCIANYWEHAQREARPLNMFMKNPDAVVGPGDTIVLPEYTVPWAFMHEAELALVIKGPAKMVKAADWKKRRVRLHLPDRCVGARAGPPHLARDAADQLARQVVRHLRADRPVHRHRRRGQGPERRRSSASGTTASFATTTTPTTWSTAFPSWSNGPPR